MRDIKNLNIWKEEKTANQGSQDYHNLDIVELSLSVRAYNCLKRAGCNSVGDIIRCMGEDGAGLMRIRNLGSRSQAEILDKIEQVKEEYAKRPPVRNGVPARVIIKPGKRVWDRRISECMISESSRARFRECGIRQVRDLYTISPDLSGSDPGWFAVRELFQAII